MSSDSGRFAGAPRPNRAGGTARLLRMLVLAQELVQNVLTWAQPADRAVAQYFRRQRQLGARDRAELANAIYHFLRHKTRLEEQAGGSDTQRRALILAFAEQGLALAAALSAVEQSWLQEALAQDSALFPTPIRYSLPPWLIIALQDQLGADFDAAAQALLRPAPLDLRVNIMRQKRAAAQKDLRGLGIETMATPWSPWGLRAVGKPDLQPLAPYQQGLIEVQDEGSQLLALLVGARRGEMVADYCAGAGGKTLAMGAAMRGSGRLYALDVVPARLEVLKKRVQRSGLGNIYPMVITDATAPRFMRLAGKMDRVLVDAPCSGLGTLRRSPDLKWRQLPAKVAEFAAMQQQILAQAARLVRPGGWLVYATCSFLTQENEAVAAAFDAAMPQFVAQPVVDALARLKVEPAASLCTADGRYLQLWPHVHGTDAFFAAMWQRRG